MLSASALPYARPAPPQPTRDEIMGNILRLLPHVETKPLGAILEILEYFADFDDDD